MLEAITFTLKGVAPLLMHNVRLADPCNDFSINMKAITSKKSKTDDDYRRLADLEWEGGLYLDPQRRPCIPGELLEAALVEAARASNKGKLFLVGVMSDGNWVVEHDGPKDIDSLRADPRFRDKRAAGVKKARVMRTRPRFNIWGCKCVVQYDPEVVNRSAVVKAMETLSRMGIMDYRPKFGRFMVEGVSDGRE